MYVFFMYGGEGEDRGGRGAGVTRRNGVIYS